MSALLSLTLVGVGCDPKPSPGGAGAAAGTGAGASGPSGAGASAGASGPSEADAATGSDDVHVAAHRAAWERSRLAGLAVVEALEATDGAHWHSTERQAIEDALRAWDRVVEGLEPSALDDAARRELQALRLLARRSKATFHARDGSVADAHLLPRRVEALFARAESEILAGGEVSARSRELAGFCAELSAIVRSATPEALADAIDRMAGLRARAEAWSKSSVPSQAEFGASLRETLATAGVEFARMKKVAAKGEPSEKAWRASGQGRRMDDQVARATARIPGEVLVEWLELGTGWNRGPQPLWEQGERLWALAAQAKAALGEAPPASKAGPLDAARCESWRAPLEGLRAGLKIPEPAAIDCARVAQAALGLRLDDADAQRWLLDRLVLEPAEAQQVKVAGPITSALRSPRPPMYAWMRARLAERVEWKAAVYRELSEEQARLCRALAYARDVDFPADGSACDLDAARREIVARPIDGLYDVETAMMPGDPTARAGLADLAWLPLAWRAMLPVGDGAAPTKDTPTGDSEVPVNFEYPPKRLAGTVDDGDAPAD